MEILKQKKFFIIRAVLLILVILCFLSFGRPDNVKLAIAGSGDNVHGFAWNANIGWISFNSIDCDTDRDGVYEGAGESGGPAPSGCPSGGSFYDYGVRMDLESGAFSGYAWSPSVGWIDFGPAVGFPEAPSIPATYDFTSGQVSGWAKILAMGDDGWIRMEGASINNITEELSGWAWNGNANGAGIGWISFDSTDCNMDNDGDIENSNCGGTPGTLISPYQVIVEFNNSPEVRNLSAPNCSYSNASQWGSLFCPQLQWEYFDEDHNDPDPDPQSKFQIVFGTNSELDLLSNGSGMDLPLNILVDDPIGRSATSFFPSSNPYRPVSLDYGTTYYWWVKVWDSNGGDSGWEEGPSFRTYNNEMPIADFEAFPENPSMGEDVQLTDLSTVFLISDPTEEESCAIGICTWSWIFPTGTTPSETSNEQNPIIQLNTEGNNEVTLRVTDQNDYYSEILKSLNAGLALPKWKEIK